LARKLINDLASRIEWEYVFLIIDILHVVRDKTVLKISADFIVRELVKPLNFCNLDNAIAASPAVNTV
jgi:hypothetical protein